MQDQRADVWFYISLGSCRPCGWHRWPWAWKYSKAGVCLFYSKTWFVFPRTAWWQVVLWAPHGPSLCLRGAFIGTATMGKRAWPCHVATSTSFCQTPRKQTPLYYGKEKTTVFSRFFSYFQWESRRGSQSPGSVSGPKTKEKPENFPLSQLSL